MSRILDFTVPIEYDGKRVVHFLRGKAKLSATLVRTLKYLDDGIMLNGKHTRTIDIIHENDVIVLHIPTDSLLPEPIEYPLDIVYEDDDILIINKPPCIAVHPTHNHQGDTVANAVAWHLNSIGKPSAFRAIGRLDKGTSGLMLCALNPYSASRLSGEINKTYLAVANGILDGSGTIDIPIIRPDANKTLRACGEGGEHAVTHWTALKSGNNMTLLSLNLETGRTHQIRVHFSHICHTLVGDAMYGDSRTDIGHQLLHCAEFRFTHPVTHKEMHITANPPEDMCKIIDEIDGKIMLK